MDYFKDLAKALDRFDSYGFRMHLARIEATKFVGEDGKEYCRFPIFPLGQEIKET